MASKDIINSVDVNNPSSNRRTSDLLPNYHRTDKNTKFLASTLDQFIQPPQVKRIDGFIGSKLSPKFNPLTDQYIDGTTKLRNDYQFEPSLVIQDVNQNVKKVLGYDDLINQLDFNNSKVSNLDRLFRPQSYSYDPMIDWDKFVNFRQYYWLPTGPDAIEITGQPRDTISTYTVRDSDNRDTLIFTPDGGTTNPLLTLYRGLTYVFNVSSYYPFYVKTSYVEGANSLYTGTTNNGIKNGQVIVTIDDSTPNNLFYFAEGNSTAVGKIVVKTIEENTTLDIETDILGKQSYTSGNQVTFSNGMKVRFVGEVTPSSYADKDFIVEGVGDKITLVDYSKLQPAGNETTNLNVNFDSNPFDEYPFDDFRFVPLTPDYITINRSAPDQNPWSRYNRWVHTDVIEATAKANGVPAIFPADRRAQRPIIEFNAGLQLHNYGSIGKDNIDLIDTKTVNAFKTVEGSPGHFIDGVRVEAGNRVIFNADTDPLVRGKIYEVKFAIIDNRQYINLEEVLDSQPNLYEAVIVKRGTLYSGTAWWFNGNTWQIGQQKTKLNQPPLWELYDKDGNRYADQAFYKSTFEGTKLFGYAVGTVSDSVLGFNVAYRNINNVGEFLFNNYFDTDTFTNFVNGEIVELNVLDGYLKLNTSAGPVFRTIWTKTVDKPMPILQYQVITETAVYVEINSITNPGYARDLTVELFVNDVKQKRNVDYVISIDDTRLYLVSNTTFSINDRVLIKLYTDQVPNENGFYEPPANLTNNPLNGPVPNFTFTEISDHVKTIVDFNGEFEGLFPGIGNLRDLGNTSAFASRIVTHNNPLSFAHYFLGTRNNNVIDAIRKVSNDYAQFKSNLLRYITELKGTYSPEQSLDTALLKLNSIKDNTFNYKNSDMLAYGNDQTTRIFSVTNSRNVKYSLASQFDDTVLSNRSVLVYLSRFDVETQQTTTRLLINGYDYVVNKFDASITIKTSLIKNDRLTVKDYPNTTGSFVPPTPTKLGLYPKFKPQLYKDDTYIADQWVIQGHDGSITVAFGNYDIDPTTGKYVIDDYRDAVLLEYETRVFNNLKIEYNPDLININEVLPGAFRTGSYSQAEVTELITPDFLKWAGFYGVDYQTNSTLNELDPFTFNYSSNIDIISKNRLTGFWRSIYKFFYDTDRPHSHPWEMLGFSEQPSWWVATYGPAPYTSGNLILWQDLEAGRIAVTSSGPTINPVYARPGLSAIIPVDGHGNLLSPTDSGLATTPIVNLNDPNRLVVLRTDQISSKWSVGDQGPAETAWRRSSSWPFACQILLALTKPATYASLMFDTSRIKKNISGEYRYGDNEIFLTPSKVSLFNDVVNDSSVLASGYSQFIIETGTAKDVNYISKLKEELANLDYRLMVKLGGFVSKDKLSVGIDAVDPTSPYPGVLIPSEDYEIFFNQSSPIESLSVSGLIIQRTPNGWSVRGYDKYKPYFTIFKPFPSNVDQIERIGGVSERFSNWATDTTYVDGQIVFYNDRYYRVSQRHNSDKLFDETYYQSLPYLPTKGGVGVSRRSAFDTVETVVPYGTEFTTVQEVYDLIVGYSKWVEFKGFAFEEYNTDLEQILDWNFTAKEFLYWTTQNWAVNSIITLSPFANKVIFRSNKGVVESISDNFYEYSLLKADGAPFPKNNFTIVRLDGEFVLSTINTQEGLFFVKINVVQKEHALVMKNFTLFNDVVYDVETGYRQRRLQLKGFITRDWNGDFFSPGFVFDQAVVNDWQKFTDYGIGDVVRFSGNYYAAIKSISGSDAFDITLWAVLNEKPTPQLLPNFEYKINQFEDFYSLDIDNFDVGQQAMAQHLIGYTPRPYLNFIIGDPIAQYKFYQGFIRDKGSRNSIDNLSKASLNNFRSSIDFNEEWAFRVGYYGGFDTYQELETSLEFNKFVENPQIIEFVQDKPANQEDNIYYKDISDIIIKPELFDISNVFSTVDVTLDDNNFKLPVAGYVRFDDVTATAYNKNSVLDIANNSSLNAGSTIWLGFKEDGNWDVLRVTDVPTVITGVAINIPGQSITLSTFYSHQLAVNDLISVVGVSPEIDQCYVVTEVTNENQFVVLSTLTILPELSNPISGLLFIFKSSRLSTFDDLSKIPFLDRWAVNEKVWIDNNGDDKWAVYRKINNYQSRDYPAPVIDVSANQHYGYKIFATTADNNSNILLVSAPDQERVEVGTPLWGKLYVLFRDTFGDTTVLSEFSLNEENSYHGTSNSSVTEFGASLAFDSRTNLVVAGAPGASDVRSVFAGTNVVNPAASLSTVSEQGVVKLVILDNIDLEPFSILSSTASVGVITTPSLDADARFGASVVLSTGTVVNSTVTNFTLLVGAPGANTSGAVYSFTATITTGTSNIIQISTSTAFLTNTSSGALSLLTSNSQFGAEIAASRTLSRVAVTAPGFVNTSSGAVFVYTSASSYVHQVITGDKDDLGDDLLSESDEFASKIKMSADGQWLVVASPKTFDKSLGIRSGVVDIFEWNTNTNLFVRSQRISAPISALTNTTKFGWDIDLNETADTLIITSLGTAKSVRPTFDNYVTRFDPLFSTVTYESIYVNDPDSLPRTRTTTFDGGSTSFTSRNVFSGNAHVYNRLGSTQYAYAEALISKDIQKESAFGFSVVSTDNSVFVGAPAKPLPGETFTGYLNGSGQFFVFDKINQASTSWELFREQEPSIDLTPIGRAITINTDTEQVQQYIDVIDPIKGNILGTASEELRYITAYDPAIYSLGIEGVNIDPNTNWLDEHIGELWWDLSTVKYVWYEQGELEYRKNNWNNVFPGSSIDVYEWVRSEYLPVEWAQLADTAEGLTRGISGQPKFIDNTIVSVKQVYNSISNAFTNVYYFWVKNKTTVPSNVANRSRPAFQIAQTIADPVGSGLPFLAILSPTSIMMANSKSLVSTEKINLNMTFNLITDSANRHTEWLLLQENDPNSRPNWLLEKKLIDSLLGRDSLGNAVPDPLLPSKLKYGVDVRPRQGLFVNRFEALRNIIEFTNDILRNQLITGTIDFTNLNAVEEIPNVSTYDSIVEDIFTLELILTNTFATARITSVINNDGQISSVVINNPGFGYLTPPTITITGSGSGAELVANLNQFGAITSVTIVKPGTNYSSTTELTVRPYTTVVQTDTNSAGKWAVYEWNDDKKLWIKTRTQSYNTSAYWKYIDWVAPNYDPLKNVVSTVASVYALEVLESLAEDTYVKVKNSGDGRYIIVRRTNGLGGTFDYNWDLVYSENGTIQFLETVWNLAGSLYAWDKLVGWDQTQYDQAPDREIEFILNAIKNDIFVSSLKGYWNQLFFKAVRYAMSEQKFLDWAFKTTFISVINNSGSLDQPATYKLENVKYYEEFLNEVKPYHTKIRKFTQQYTNTELTNTFNTDFDLPAYYNTSTLNFNKVEFGNDLLLQYPWKAWYDNYTYTVETIDLYDSGDGYTQIPQVTIVTAQGDSGFGATAVAFIAAGKVSKILVTNPGQRYTTTPTVVLSGGGDTALTPARAYARLGGSPIRSNSITMRFDRVSTAREIGSQRFTDKFIGDGFDVTFPLTWVPVADKTEITLTNNGLLCLIDSYTILYETAKFNPQTNTEYSKKYAILSLNFIPNVGDVIEITYPKSLSLYNAADRIEDYYVPGPGMPGKDLAQLMTGVEYSGLIVEGLPFNFSGGWDAVPFASTAWDNYGVEEGYVTYSTTTAFTTQTYAIPTLITTGTEVNVYLRSLVDLSVSGKRIDNPNYENFKGVWSSSVGYTATDIVLFNNTYYRALTSIASSSTIIVPSSTSSWSTVQYSENVSMTTLIGNGTGAVDTIQVLIPGSGYNAPFTTLSIAPPNTVGGTQATGSLRFKAVNATVATTGTGYAVGDILTIGTVYGTATVTVSRVSPTTGTVVAVTILDAGIFVGGTSSTSEILTSSDVVTPNTATVSLTYGVLDVIISSPGSGYTESPAITIVESINTGNEISSVTVPAFARATLRAEFRNVNSTTTLSHLTVPAIAFTTTSSLVVLRYATSDGTVTPTDQDSLDAIVDGGNLNLTTALGVNPAEIILDGGSQATRHITRMLDDGFLNSINSFAPEECVPGQIQESVGISVYTQPPTVSPIISTKQYWYNGSQLTFKLGIKPTSQDSVLVVYNKQKISRLQNANPVLPVNYTINFDTNTVTFTAGALTGSGWVSLTAMEPGSLTLLDTIVLTTTSTNSVITSGARYSDVGSSYVTVNGISLVQNPSTSTSITLAINEYQITNYRGRAKLKVQSAGTIQAYFFNGTDKSFSEIYEQERVLDETILYEEILQRPPGVAAPFHSQVIVTTSRGTDKNKSRLRPPVTTYYQAVGGQRIFDISQTKVYPTGSIGSGDLEVYVNGVQRAGGTVWILNQPAGQIEFSTNYLLTNDVIAIVIKRDYDYLVQNGRVVLTNPLVTGNTISTITFTNHDPDFIRTDRFDANAGGQYTMQRPVLDSSYVWVTFNGKPLIANVDYGIENNNRTVILRDGLYTDPLYNNDTVQTIHEIFETTSIDVTSATNYFTGDILSFGGPGWASPAEIEISVTTASGAISVSRIVDRGVFTATTLPTGLLEPIGFTANPYAPFHVPSGIKMSFSFKNTTVYPTPTVLVTSFADIVPLVGYRIFRDMLGRTHYKRISGENTTVLAQDFYLRDSYIVVEDVSVLTVPNPQYNRPGVIFIDGERIEFFVIQGNILSQLRRSTLGTGPRDIHYAGTQVVDQGSNQTIPFKEEVQRFTTSTTSTSTLTVSVVMSNIDFTDSANYWDQVEVKYAGRTLLKPGLSTVNHDFTVAYDSNEVNSYNTSSDSIVYHQFTITNGTNILEIYPSRIEGYTPGRRIEVIRRTSRSWYNSTTTTTLTKSNTLQAKFLTEKAAAIPPFMSSSTYVAADLTLYLDGVYGVVPLQDENDNPLEGI
jgi:hypothetical protein